MHPNSCAIEIVERALYGIVDRELVNGDGLSPGEVWRDDVAEHNLRVTALGGDDFHARRFAVYCRSCKIAVHDKTPHLRDAVCRHLRDSLTGLGFEAVSRLSRWTQFIQEVSSRASHGGPAPIRTTLEVAIRRKAEIVVRVFMSVENAMSPWKTATATQARLSEVVEGEPTARIVRDLVLQAWAHELDEHLYVGGHLAFDPHDETLAIRPIPRIVPPA